MKNGITIGQAVTWGSGQPRAEVVDLPRNGSEVSLVLSMDLKSPCGRVFPKGTRLTMAYYDLRTLA